MRKEKLAALLGIPAAVALTAGLSEIDKPDPRKAAADIFSREAVNGTLRLVIPLQDEFIPPPAYEPATLYQETPVDIHPGNLEKPLPLFPDPNTSTTLTLPTPKIVPQSENLTIYERGDNGFDGKTDNQTENLISTNSTAVVPIPQERTVSNVSNRGHIYVQERHEESNTESQPTYQEQIEMSQPSQEVVEFLAQTLSDEIGNNPDNWKQRVINALSFANYLKENPQILQQINNFSPTPEEIKMMEEKYEQLKEEFNIKGNDASKAAQVIALGERNGQLDKAIFKKLGKPLQSLNIAALLILWGTEETWLEKNDTIPENWSHTAFVTNALTGMSFGAVLIANYNPNSPKHAIFDTIAAARYYQNTLDAEEHEFEWMADAPWLSRWNPASELWHERMDQYYNALKLFVHEFPEYDFIFENMVDSPKSESTSFSMN